MVSSQITDIMEALGFLKNHCRAMLRIAAAKVANLPKSAAQQLLLSRLLVCPPALALSVPWHCWAIHVCPCLSARYSCR